MARDLRTFAAIFSPGWGNLVLRVFSHVFSIYANLLERKKAFAWEESSIPTGLVWNTNMVAVSLFWNTNMAPMTSCKNALSVFWISAVESWCPQRFLWRYPADQKARRLWVRDWGKGKWITFVAGSLIFNAPSGEEKHSMNQATSKSSQFSPVTCSKQVHFICSIKNVCCERFEARSHFISRLSLIVRVNVVLNRTVVVGSDWRFDKLCSSHLQSQSVLYHVSWWYLILVIALIGQ